MSLLGSSCLGDWNEYRFDGPGTSVTLDDAVTPANAARLVQQWRFNPSDHPCWSGSQRRPWSILATPVVHGNDVVVLSNNGCAYDLDRATGQEKWGIDFGFQPGYDISPTAPPDQPHLYTFRCQATGFVASPAFADEPTGLDANGNVTTTPFLYLHDPKGFLDKLDPTDHSSVWRVALDTPVNPYVDDYYPWTSVFVMQALGPTHRVVSSDGSTTTEVHDGVIFLGGSSNCDLPFAPGFVEAIDMYTGKSLWKTYMEPTDPGKNLYDVGGGIWEAMSSDGTSIFAATGSITPCNSGGAPADPYLHNPYKFDPVTGDPIPHDPTPGSAGYDSDNVVHECNPGGLEYSLVRLDATTGNVVCHYRVPNGDTPIGDPDMASGTTVFHDASGRALFGGSSKNGYFYAVRVSDCSLAWKVLIGSPTPDGGQAALSGAVFDAAHDRLFLGGNDITSDPDGEPGSGDETVKGRVREVDPATGATIWETLLPVDALGAGTLNGAGLLAYAGMDWGSGPGNGVFLLDVNHGGNVVTVLKDSAFGASGCSGYVASDPTTHCSWPQFAQAIAAQGEYWMANMAAISPFKVQ
jgi:outer membrane protein assembly factor BamB